MKNLRDAFEKVHAAERELYAVVAGMIGEIVSWRHGEHWLDGVVIGASWDRVKIHRDSGAEYWIGAYRIERIQGRISLEASGKPV